MQPAFVALALAVDLCDGATGDPEDSLAATDGAEHSFSLSGDECFPYSAERLLDLDGCSLGSSPQADHQMANCKVWMAGLCQSYAS
jgi:hypothetical protein